MTIRDTVISREATAGVHSDADVAFQMNEDVFRGFYDRTSRLLWAYLARLTGDRQAADDLLQECYYRFLRADAALESESHRRHYLFRIATNLAHDGFRRRRTQPLHVSHEDAGETPAPDGSDGRAGAIDRRMDLSRAMDRLKPRERAMLWLAYAEGASHEEIAGMVGVRRSSVKSLLFRARRKLADLLDWQKELQ